MYIDHNYFMVTYSIRHNNYQIQTLSEISSTFDLFTFLYVIMLDVTICIVSCLECKDVVYESTLLIFNTSPLFLARLSISVIICFIGQEHHRVLLGVFRKFATFYSFLKYH